MLWVLRDVLGMTGTKFGCGQALCGACTVHVDGAATRSCITTVDSIGESAITTSVRLAARTGDGPEPMGLTPSSLQLSIDCLFLAHCVISVPRNQWVPFVRKQTSSGSRNPQHRSKLTRQGALPAGYQGAHPRVHFEPWIAACSLPGTRGEQSFRIFAAN